jgi:hypothetical protein
MKMPITLILCFLVICLSAADELDMLDTTEVAEATTTSSGVSLQRHPSGASGLLVITFLITSAVSAAAVV